MSLGGSECNGSPLLPGLFVDGEQLPLPPEKSEEAASPALVGLKADSSRAPIMSPSHTSSSHTAVASSKSESITPILVSLDPNKFEELLGRAAVRYGAKRFIFATPYEIEKFDIEKVNVILLLFKLQYFKDELATLRYRYCLNYGSVVISFLFAFFLLMLTLIVYLIGRNYVQFEIPYKSEDLFINFSITDPKWSDSNPTVAFFNIKNFRPVSASVYSSRPHEFFGGYSCGTDTKLVKDLLRVRAAKTLPLTANTTDPESVLFPCGLSSFSYFNDEAEIHDRKDNTIEYSDIHLAESESLILFAESSRPYPLTPNDDWLDVLSSRYRAWMFPAAGSSQTVTFGRFLNLSKGDYVLHLISNLWPAEQWRATKSVVLAQMSSIGSPQRRLAAILAVFAIVYFLGGLILAVLVYSKTRILTQSAADLPDVEDIVRQIAERNALAIEQLKRPIQ